MKDKTREFISINIAILTVSDTRTIDEDKSGDLLAQRVTDSGHLLASRSIVSDEKNKIVQILEKWVSDKDIDVILTTGGTGLTGRDVTVEAHKEIYEKEIEAFGTIFSIVSMKKIGTSAIQSRACAGVALGTYLFALPGSPSACRDAWDEILVFQFDYRHLPCNFVELIPRLDEVGRNK